MKWYKLVKRVEIDFDVNFNYPHYVLTILADNGFDLNRPYESELNFEKSKVIYRQKEEN